jgi:phosphopantetheinyl transferase
MIYTVFAEISDFDAESIIKKGCKDRPEAFSEIPVLESPVGSFSEVEIPLEVMKHILKANNLRLRKERCAAYYLLSALCQKIIGFVPKIEWNNIGKPCFVNTCLHFNLSHTNNMVAVTLSDQGSVGVDVEGEIEEERAARLERRFFSELSISDRPLKVQYFYCQFGPIGGKFIPLDECFSDCDSILKDSTPIKSFEKIFSSESFAAKWTLFEASLKCDGGGFTSLPCLNMLLLETKADIRLIVTEGEKYYLSTSLR